MPTFKKKGGATSAPQEFFIGRQLPVDALYNGVPGDAGAIVKMIQGRNDEKLIRLYNFQKFNGKKSFECGMCGLKFISEYFREAHGRMRHAKKRISIINMEDLSPEQKEIMKAEAGQPDLRPGDPGYYVSPGEFHVPDPTDRDMAALDQQLMNEIPWDKTAASVR